MKKLFIASIKDLNKIKDLKRMETFIISVLKLLN